MSAIGDKPVTTDSSKGGTVSPFLRKQYIFKDLEGSKNKENVNFAARLPRFAKGKREAKIMTRSILTTAAALAALLICGCQGTQSNTSNAPASNANTTAATKPDPKVVDEIKALLARHDKALNEKNVADVLSTFSNEANTVVLGTGKGERFVGTDAIKEAYTEIFKDYDAGTLEVTCDWKTGGADSAGTTAWMAATCPAKDSLKGVKRDYFLNVSAAAVKGADGWRFAMLHMSNGGDPGPPPSGKDAPASSSNSATPANSNSAPSNSSDKK